MKLPSDELVVTVVYGNDEKDMNSEWISKRDCSKRKVHTRELWEAGVFAHRSAHCVKAFN